MKIGQADSAIIDRGAISSDEHVTCCNVVILNLEKREALMCHVWEGGYGGFSFSQLEHVKRFTSRLGDKVAFIVESMNGNSSTEVRRELEKRGVLVLPTEKLEMNGVRWGVEFALEERQITVCDEYGVVHYQGMPFPPFVELLPHEHGLDDRERIAAILYHHADPVTFELHPEACAEFERILHLPIPGQFDKVICNVALHRYVDKRALEAGFDDSTDYLQADPKHFIDVSIDSPELVLRKVIGGYATRKFDDSCFDFTQVKITPVIVMELLDEFPELLAGFARFLDSARVLEQGC